MRLGTGSSMLIALRRNRILTVRRVARLRIADLEIDALDRRIVQGTREIPLSPSEHILLYTLAAAAGTVLPYRDLATALGNGREPRHNMVARHVVTLRQKLGDDPRQPRYIETVFEVGYRFVAHKT